jgi:hypothetical protein
MRETEWLGCIDPYDLLDFCRGKLSRDERPWFAWLGLQRNPASEARKNSASERKLRLFACACCRRIWSRLIQERSRKAVETAERYADGLADEAELRKARAAAPCVTGAERAAAWAAAPTADAAAEGVASATQSAEAGGRDLPWLAGKDAAAREEHRVCQCGWFRDIMGNPFQPTYLKPACLQWKEGAIPKMAHSIYQERRFTDLPILADALAEAGCTDQTILDHCRQAGEHVRGCWVVDLCLGRE